jgi:hypothetical protein
MNKLKAGLLYGVCVGIVLAIGIPICLVLTQLCSSFIFQEGFSLTKDLFVSMIQDGEFERFMIVLFGLGFIAGNIAVWTDRLEIEK